jgi:hypothetical protein
LELPTRCDAGDSTSETFSKNVPRSSVKPEQNWLTAVLSVLFSAKDKRREKTGVSNGMKPRTQMLDKTQKKE